MHRLFLVSALVFGLASPVVKALNQYELKAPQGPYLGQTPPTNTPKPFAPNLVSTKGYEYSGVFNPQMDEFYYISGDKDGSKQLFVMYKNVGKHWQQSVVSKRVGQPFIAPDGKTLHLGRRFMEKTGSGWSEVQMLAAPFNDILIMRLTASSQGTYFFDTYDPDNLAFPLRYSRIVDGQRQAPQKLDKTINTGTYISHPFIAADESYLIWDAKRDEGYGDSDLYISYKQPDGTWSQAINLGDKINTSAWDAAGHVTPDGKYFFFQRLIRAGKEGELPDVDIFWVSADFIETLKPAHLKGIQTAKVDMGKGVRKNNE